MRCFELIKTVLDELYVQIPAADDDEKDDRIKACMNHLSDQYRTCLSSGVSIDYNDPAIRFAYIYIYTTAHAAIVYMLIKKSPDLMALFDSDKVVAACPGGGPGSDFLGMLKYMTMHGKQAMLKCYLFDREPAWGESWSDVDDKLGPSFRISTYFQPFDVTNPSTWSLHTKYLGSDLFTSVFFVSEIHSVRNQAQAYFDSLFASANPGSFFLYVDNRDYRLRKWFDSLAQTHQWDILQGDSCRMSLVELWETEKIEDLGIYDDKFDFSPRLTASVDYRICQKAFVL